MDIGGGIGLYVGLARKFMGIAVHVGAYGFPARDADYRSFGTEGHSTGIHGAFVCCALPVYLFVYRVCSRFFCPVAEADARLMPDFLVHNAGHPDFHIFSGTSPLETGYATPVLTDRVNEEAILEKYAAVFFIQLVLSLQYSFSF